MGDIFGVDLPEGVEKFAEALEEGIPEVDLSDMRTEFTDTEETIVETGENSAEAVEDAADDIDKAMAGLDPDVQKTLDSFQEVTDSSGEMKDSVLDDLDAIAKANKTHAENELTARQTEWGVTEAEYLKAQIEIRRMDSESKVKLLAQAEQYGIDDLALAKAHFKSLAFAQQSGGYCCKERSS